MDPASLLVRPVTMQMMLLSAVWPVNLSVRPALLPHPALDAFLDVSTPANVLLRVPQLVFSL